MITQYDIPALLHEEIPDLPIAINTHCSRFITTDVYASINSFSVYTKHAVAEHHFGIAKKCFVVAGKMYPHGDAAVRLLIENIFVYAFSSFIPEKRTDKFILKTITPPVLYKIYLKQVMAGGC